ncbi:hypothetical protein DAEQUDRAFT_814331 [Daedalea quercina L-15889]|uniref:Uncharacterized protein n=1 Tax=Daedalea quercina L-15889 TaxID=1314783 RepID=A0A165M848_9APHY|nr:hypothetical protein DAEQUDRAFT_814331 [Daedalea quercina L-15889]
MTGSCGTGAAMANYNKVREPERTPVALPAQLQFVDDYTIIQKIDSPTGKQDLYETFLLAAGAAADFERPEQYFVALTGGQIHVLPALFHPLLAEIALKIGDMYGASAEQGIMVGFQVWTPPGEI